ncbi:sensor histidine kinase [Enterococcus sp. LJL128]
MKNKKRQNSWRNSSRHQLSVRFTLLLSAAILLLSFSIVAVLTRELYDSTKNQAEMLTETMENADTENQAKWLDFLETYTSGDSSPYLVRVTLSSGEVIFSHEAKTVFNHFSSMKQLFFLDNILWDSDGDPYFYTTMAKDGATAAILVDIEDQFELIQSVLILTSILTIVILLIGSILIYRFANVFSRPLRLMNEEIGELSRTEEQEGVLTVPNSPQEVKYVSESFNDLLMKQRNSMEREKQFVTDVSHELRTPLAAIRGHVDLINRRGTKHPEVIPKSIHYIDSESRRMTVMVEQLLVLGRGEQKASSMLHFSAVLQLMLDELQVMIQQEIVTEIDEQVYLEINEDNLRQIIRNLIENAAKYTTIDGKIFIRLLQKKESVDFEVADTGLGITEEDKELIFNRFYRADRSRSSRISGSGVGLAIVQELVKQYHGSIEVLDNAPQGSRFIVRFPIKK